MLSSRLWCKIFTITRCAKCIKLYISSSGLELIFIVYSYMCALYVFLFCKILGCISSHCKRVCTWDNKVYSDLDFQEPPGTSWHLQEPAGSSEWMFLCLILELVSHFSNFNMSTLHTCLNSLNSIFTLGWKINSPGALRCSPRWTHTSNTDLIITNAKSYTVLYSSIEVQAYFIVFSICEQVQSVMGRFTTDHSATHIKT